MNTGTPIWDPSFGVWRRPQYYASNGPTMEQAIGHECRAVRGGLGILDASTLGKIDIRGKDAAEFLNRVYTNRWDTLAVGRCRYGVMLHEDGMVFDDGVTARLAEHHYVMSTTTGGAAGVFHWLDDWLQSEWPDLEVYLTSVTTQWATITLAGPNSRRLLAEVCNDVDVSADAFPFMSIRRGTVAGMRARIYSISFTGELSFEVNVAASYAEALWQALMLAGAKHGITPFGVEAMDVLRAEKGHFIVGRDSDGTVSPLDLGLDWLISTKKTTDFIGRRSLAREDSARQGRPQFVGLLAEDAATVLPEGGQIIAGPATLKPVPGTNPPWYWGKIPATAPAATTILRSCSATIRPMGSSRSAFAATSRACERASSSDLSRTCRVSAAKMSCSISGA